VAIPRPPREPAFRKEEVAIARPIVGRAYAHPVRFAKRIALF